MASFTATFSTHPNASVGSCYALTIKDPDPDSRQNEMITAYVGPDFGLTVISKDLALAHTPDGIVREGQEIQLCIQQTEPSTLSHGAVRTVSNSC